MSVYMAIMGTDSLWSSEHAMTNTVNWDGDEDFDYGDHGSNQFQIWYNEDRNGDIARVLDDMYCAAPCRGSQDVGGCANYELHASHNCWTGHGAQDIDGHEPVGTMDLADCLAQCDNTSNCEGVVTSLNDNGTVQCYRKTDITIGDCDWYPVFDTWMKK